MTAVPDLRTELGAAPLERDVLHVSGPEAAGFLQGQLSQDVEAMAVGDSALSLLLEPTGKVAAWLRVTRLADDRYLLDLDVGHGEAATARLRRFRLRTKVDIELEQWAGVAVRGPGSADVTAPAGAHAMPCLWPGVEGVDVLGPQPLPDLHLPEASVDALLALRIEAGVPAMGAELTESTIPAEAGQWLVAASVSFTKGCYTGQELVARIDSRGGKVPRPLRGLLVEGDVAPAGADVVVSGDGGDEAPSGESAASTGGDEAPGGGSAAPTHGGDGASSVGTVTSSAWSPALGPVALAIVARSVEPGTRVQVRWAGGAAPATVAELPLR